MNLNYIKLTFRRHSGADFVWSVAPLQVFWLSSQT